MLLLSKSDIKKVFSMKDAIEADKLAFQMLEEGNCEVPLRVQIQAKDDKGTFLFMPAYSGALGAAGLKVVNVFPDNTEKGLPTTPAQVFLVDGETGMVSAIMDGTYITQVRTGAASGAAFDLLAKKECEIGALIGTGGQAAAQLEAMLVARKLKEVRVVGRNYDRTVAFVEVMKEELKEYQVQIVAVKTSDEAIENADLIITVTTATEPVFDGTKVKPGATISCVGGYQPHMQEIDPAVLPRTSKIYFDSQTAVLSEAGDILIPLEQGIITEKNFTGNLGDVVRGVLNGRENDEEIIVFKSVGVAVQDLVTAKAIYDKAVEKNIGHVWE